MKQSSEWKNLNVFKEFCLSNLSIGNKSMIIIQTIQLQAIALTFFSSKVFFELEPNQIFTRYFNIA